MSRENYFGDYNSHKNLILYPDIEKYKLVKLLGKGYDGDVYLYKIRTSSNSKDYKINKSLDPLNKIYNLLMNSYKSNVIEYDKNHVAIKIINSKILNETEPNKKEIEIHSSLHHDNIVPVLLSFSGQNLNQYLIMEYQSGGDMFDYIRNNGPLDDEKAGKWILSIMKATDYCHQKGIIHRDIKLENILINETGNVKLTDFGWAFQNSTSNGLCGTDEYISPEMLLGYEYDYKIDIWCIGIVLYEITVGRPPFYHPNRSLLKRKILKNKIKYPFNFSPDAESLINQLLRSDPIHRIELSEAMKHPFIKLR
jgi:aurora kinase